MAKKTNKGLIKSTYNPVTKDFMASKELQLTIGERLQALRLFDEFKGSITQMASIFDDCKACGVSEADFTAANMQKEYSPDKTTYNMTWTEEGSEKAVSVTQEGVDYLLGKIKAKSDAGELTLADKATLTLDQKLK